MIANDHVIRLDDDSMGLHRARWALRRIRSDLKTFTSHFDNAYLDHLRTELRWLSEEFGTLRRADVLVESVELATASARDNDVAAVERLIDRARRERQRAHASVIEILESKRYLELLDLLVGATRPTALFSGESAAAVEVIPTAMMRVWKRVRSAVGDMPEEPSENDIRHVRRQIIRLRSATELSVPVFGAAASDFAVLTAKAQHDLGVHLDALACERWLRSRVASLEGLEPFVAGQLVSAQSVISDQALRAWLESWRACSKRSAVAWFRS
jgi:CHAD domain-containing protein